jgi:hypothetical protein
MVARAAPSSRPPDAIASALSGATFARILAPVSGDAVAATAILDAALPCPTQIRPLAPADDPAAVAAVGDATDTRILLDDAASADATPVDAVDVRLSGRGGAVPPSGPADEPTATAAGDRPLSVVARDVARQLGTEPGSMPVFAGCVAAGVAPETVVPDLLERAIHDGILTRRPGVAIPGSDLADGLAHSTLLAGPFSGDVEDARATLEAIDVGDTVDSSDEDSGRRVASAVVCSILEDESVPERAATAVERAVRPLAIPDGPFDTVGGLADVLDATVRTDPGLGTAMALGLTRADGPDGDEVGQPIDNETVDAALSSWREFAQRVHAVDGEAPGPVANARTNLSATHLPTVARLHRDFRVEADAVSIAGESAVAVAGPVERTADVAAAIADTVPSSESRVTTSTAGVVLVTPFDSDPDAIQNAVQAVIGE